LVLAFFLVAIRSTSTLKSAPVEDEKMMPALPAVCQMGSGARDEFFRASTAD